MLLTAATDCYHHILSVRNYDFEWPVYFADATQP